PGVRRTLLEGGGSTAVRHRGGGGRTAGRDSTRRGASSGATVSLRYNDPARPHQRCSAPAPPARADPNKSWPPKKCHEFETEADVATRETAEDPQVIQDQHVTWDETLHCCL